MSYKHILFDLDGTLTNPAVGITNSIMYALRKLGEKVPPREELYSFIGPPLVDNFEAVFGFSKEKARLAVDCYREYFSVTGLFENEVYEGIEPLLKKLKEDGRKIFLATSKPEEFATQILEHFSLLQYFDFVAGNTLKEDRSKKEDVLKYILKKHPEINGENAVMVGDRKYDVLGAGEVNLNCIGVLYGFGDEKEMRECGAFITAKTVTELENILMNGDNL